MSGADIPDPPPTPRTHGGTPIEGGGGRISLTDAIRDAFHGIRVGAGAFTVELSDAVGLPPSGAKEPRRQVRLVPGRPGHHVFVAATMNPAERRADLRDYDHVSILYELRHRGSFPITSKEWEEFLHQAEVVFNGAGVQSMRTPPPRELLMQRRHAERVSKTAVVAFVVVMTLATFVMWRVIVALRGG